MPPMAIRPPAPSAKALGLVRHDDEGTVTRALDALDGKDGKASQTGDDEDFDGLETLARRPDDDGNEATLARPISRECRTADDGEPATRAGSNAAVADPIDLDENDETLMHQRAAEPETIPRGDRVHADAPTTTAQQSPIPPPPPPAVAPTNAPSSARVVEPAPWQKTADATPPPPAQAIRTPFAMVTDPEDNLTRVAPLGQPVRPLPQPPSNRVVPLPQAAPTPAPPVGHVQQVPSSPPPQAGPLPQAPSAPSAPVAQAPAPSAASTTPQRPVLFVAATLLVAAAVFLLLRPASAPRAAAADPPPEPVPVEEVPAPVAKPPPVAAVIAPPEPLTAAPPPTTQPPTATEKTTPSSRTAATNSHRGPRRKHVHKHRIPTRREQ